MIDPRHQSPVSSCDDALLAELVEEISRQLEAGDPVDLDSYSRRFPAYADQLRRLVPALDILRYVGTLPPRNLDADRSTLHAPAAQLGDFRVLSQIGRGGMGVVYEAEQLSLGRRVALKILPFASLLDEHQLQRFHTEATAAGRLQHPHIVPVYSVGCQRGVHYYAMQLIDGPSLAEVIAQLRERRTSQASSPAGEQPDAAETIADAAAHALTTDAEGADYYRGVARVGRAAAEALHYAHQQGVLHRDIKPSNLLLDAAGHVWIADFGLARLEDASQLTRSGDVLGTLRYMSPEQASGRREEVDVRSDVYSLGATLYELATLRPVGDRPTRRQMIHQVAAGSPPPPQATDRRIPRPLSRVIGKALQRGREDRYPSAQELADDLRRFLDGEPVHAKPTPLPRRARDLLRRHRPAVAVTFAILAVALVATALTHHFAGRITVDSPSKGEAMHASTAGKVAAVVAAMSLLAPETASAQIVATTTDRNFLEVDVNKVSCQTEFDLAINVSGTGTHYRYKVGPSAITNPGVLTGYSSPIAKTTPVSFNLTGQADVRYVLCLQGLELDRRGKIKKSQPLSQATAYYWTKDTAPVEYRVTFVEPLSGFHAPTFMAIDTAGSAVGRSYCYSESVYHAVRWMPGVGMEDIGALNAPWFDVETDPPTLVDGWYFEGAFDVNAAGHMAGYASDGNSNRAALYDGTAYILLPRLQQPPYNTARYRAMSINDNGDIQGAIPDHLKTFLWSPTRPGTIDIIDPTSSAYLASGIGSDLVLTHDDRTDVASLYAFSYAAGSLWFQLLDTIPMSGTTLIAVHPAKANEHGDFAYVSDTASTQSVKLYRPGLSGMTVRETETSAITLGWNVNDSSDFVYNIQDIPYLYRHREDRSYRLYDLTDSSTKSILFASSTGNVKDSQYGVHAGVVSDDNAAGHPQTDPFDTIAGYVIYDSTTGSSVTFVLMPVQK